MQNTAPMLFPMAVFPFVQLNVGDRKNEIFRPGTKHDPLLPVTDVFDDVVHHGLGAGVFSSCPFSTWRTAYTTVEWSRPPKVSPISTMDIWVISRTMYMETCRALEMLALRFWERMSSGVMPP